MQTEEREKPSPVNWCKGSDVLVVGLGRFGGGVGVVKWLAGQGANVRVTDCADSESLASSMAAIADLPVRCRFGGHDVSDLEGVDLAVINPAIEKRKSEFFRAIVRKKIPWTTEINLFCERCPCKVIGVTGTYGKSTTCAMLVQALRACRQGIVTGNGAVHLGGNFGGSLLTMLDRIGDEDLVVLELSSAQLEDFPRINWTPDVAVITNLYPHHLDRYDDFTAYVQSKLNILGVSDLPGSVVVGDLDQAAERIFAARLHDSADCKIHIPSVDADLTLSIPGKHNRLNAACALSVCQALGMDERLSRDALRSFKGLEHRLEKVLTVKGVAYYNDSKSTSPAATARAVEAMKRPLISIVGGKQKVVPLDQFAAVLADRCLLVICVGESGPSFARAVRAAACGDESATVREAADLDEAVRLAQTAARPGSTVLFSPGAPSFDAFVNFAERGRRFAEIVRSLG